MHKIFNDRLRKKYHAQVIGITGESGVGKTEISAILTTLLPRSVHIHAGDYRRVVLKRHKDELFAKYGSSVLDETYQVAHEFIINNPEQYEEIKKAIQPEFDEELLNAVKKAKRNYSYVIVERTNLMNMKAWRLCDTKVLIQASLEKRNAFRMIRGDHVGHKLEDLGMRDKLSTHSYDKCYFHIVLFNEHTLDSFKSLAVTIAKLIKTDYIKPKKTMEVSAITIDKDKHIPLMREKPRF